MNFKRRIDTFLNLFSIPWNNKSVEYDEIKSEENLFAYAQFLNKSQYVDLFNNSQFKVPVKFTFLLFSYYISDSVYYSFYNFLARLKKQQKQFKKEIEAVQQFVKSLYFKFYTLDCFEHDESIWKFFAKQKDYTLVDVSNFYRANYLSARESFSFDKSMFLYDSSPLNNFNKICDFLFNDEKLNLRLNTTLPAHLNFLIYSTYRITRIVRYNNLESEYFTRELLKVLKNLKDELFNNISVIFPEVNYRIYSLLSCYYNIYIKNILDSSGTRNIKDVVDEYSTDINFCNTHILKYTQLTSTPKAAECIFDIVNYYNFIREENNRKELVNQYIYIMRVIEQKMFLKQTFEDHIKYNISSVYFDMKEIGQSFIISSSFVGNKCDFSANENIDADLNYLYNTKISRNNIKIERELPTSLSFLPPLAFK